MGIAVKSDKIITLSDKVIVTQRSTNVEYGYLYNWYAVNNAHGLAPDGWHIPTTTERDTLITYLVNNGYGYGGSGNDVAKAIASKTTWNASASAGTPGNDSASNNLSGLNLHTSGYRYYTGVGYYSIGDYCWLWTATQKDATYGYYEQIAYDSNTPAGSNYPKSGGLAVRWVRDNDTGWNGQKLVDIDGNIYTTVKIGTQIWTCQNAATTKYKDGTAIPLITDNTAWGADTTGARCAYNNDNNYVLL